MDLKKLEHFYEGSILNWNDILKYRTDIPVIEKIKKGSHKPTLFLPFMGEFGFFINTYIRFIHYFNCPKKIVCCRPGEEIFFPSVDEFVYDWDDFQEDKNRLGANVPNGNRRYRDLKNNLKKKYLGHEVIEIANEISYRFIQFMPIPLNPFCENIEVDIVIGPRNRPRDKQRNFPKEKWQKIIDEFKNYKIGIVGQKETSFDFDDAVVRNWDHDRPADAMINMIQNCKLFIGTDTGTSHIAAMCGCPMIIFRKKDWSTDFVPFMRQQNKSLVFIEDGWQRNDKIVSESYNILTNKDYLENKKEKTFKVCMHIPLHVSTHNHAKMVLEKKKLFKNLRALDIDTIFTIDKDNIGIDLSDVPHIVLDKDTGIVDPTQKAIEYFESRHGLDCFMIRTGQDVKIDIEGLYEHLQWLRNRNINDKFLAGVFDRHNDIFSALKEIGIYEKQRMIRFIQGNFMSAPINVWKYYYNNLPPSVKHYKDDSIMSFCLERDGGKLEKINKFWHHEPNDYFDNFLLQGKDIQSIYQNSKNSFSDVKDLLPIYEKYANKVESIIEFRKGQNPTTLCFAASKAKRFCTYNKEGFSLEQEVKLAVGDKFFYYKEDSLDVNIPETDLLHLDTSHNYDKVFSELSKHHQKVRRYILIHDYEIFGNKGDDGKSPGIKKAVDDFIRQHPEWKIEEKHKKSNGLVVLSKNENKKEISKINLDAIFLYRLFLPKEDEEKMLYLRLFRERTKDFKEKITKNIKVILIIDNSSESIIEKIKSEFSNDFDIEITNSKTYRETLSSGRPCSSQRYTLYVSSMNLALKYASENTVVYFCEDDYLYRPDAFEKAYFFLNKHPNDFVTLFDHPDRYKDSSRKAEPKISGYELEILWEFGHHWRTSISTCHTFVGTMKSLKLNERLMLRANKERRDHDMWCDMWKDGKSKLYGSIPGLASHRRGPHLEDWNWKDLEDEKFGFDKRKNRF